MHAVAKLPDATRRAGRDERSYGLLRVGGAMLAVPVAVLSEVIPCPLRLDPLPLPVPALLGALSLRGTVIPVLDLNTALDLTAQAAPPSAGQVVVVVVIEVPGAGPNMAGKAPRRVLGLRADAVCGMARLPASQLTALAAHAAATAANTAAAAAATHSFEHEAAIVTLIDVAAIAAMPGVPTGCEAKPAAADADADAAFGPPPDPLLLFRCGDLLLGVPTASVDATVPKTAVVASTLRTGLCLGVIEHHGQDVPVVDTLCLLGLGVGVPADAASVAALVLRLPTGRLALAIDAVIDIVHPARSALLALPALALDKAELFAGVLAGADGAQHFLLDAPSLGAHPLLAALAGMVRATQQAAAAGQPAAKAPSAKTSEASQALAGTAASSYLTFDAGVETAAPLLHISEILPYPAHATRLASRHAAVLGSFVHRGSAVPLVCLSTLLGQAATTEFETARVLLVRRPDKAGAGETDIGFVVRSLSSIENARWEHAGAGPRRPALIEVGQGAQQRTLPRIDLQRIALRDD